MAVTDAAIRQRLRSLASGGWGAKAKLARQIGVGRSYLGHVIAGEKAPGPSILRYLGLERTHTIRRKRP